MTIEQKWIKAGIGEAYHDCFLDSFSGDEEALKQVETYVDNIHIAKRTGIGIYAYGPNGTGKTYLMTCILKRVMELVNPRTRQEYKARKTSLGEIMTYFTKGWYDDETRLEFENQILNVDWLLIDDPEKAYIPTNNNEIHKAALDRVLRYRVERHKPILITSNQEPKLLSTVFGPAIGSLLAESMLKIKFNGGDFRKENAAEGRWKKELTELNKQSSL